MIKPIAGPSSVHVIDRARGPGPVVRSTPIEAAAKVLARTPFERALRDSLHALRERVVTAQTETDPLNRHLGFRVLRSELTAATPDLEAVDDAEEREWAEALLDSIKDEAHLSYESLTPDERQDFEVLLRFEAGLAARTEFHQRVLASRQLARSERANLERLTHQPRTGTTLLFAAGALCLGWMIFSVIRSTPATTWFSFAASVVLLSAGGWLAANPRRALEALRSAEAKERDAREGLRHALKVFEDMEAESQREEAAARAVLLRRPGIERFVAISAPQVTPAMKTAGEVSPAGR